jgi:hypothetical protein
MSLQGKLPLGLLLVPGRVMLRRWEHIIVAVAVMGKLLLLQQQRPAALLAPLLLLLLQCGTTAGALGLLPAAVVILTAAAISAARLPWCRSCAAASAWLRCLRPAPAAHTGRLL